MASENYYGKCGSCKFCELGDTYFPFGSSTPKFKCSKAWNSTYVWAKEDPCNCYEPDRTRTNDIIEKYVKG